MSATANALPLSLFELIHNKLGADFQTIQCSKITLVHISHTLEDMVLSRRLPAMMFTGFQESSHWQQETERYLELAQVVQQVCIFAGAPLPQESNAQSIHVTLSGDDPLRQEWFVAILSTEFAVVLAGQDRQSDATDDSLRQFDTLWSFEPAIIEPVLDLLAQTVATYRPDRLADLQSNRSRFPIPPVNTGIVTQFTLEMIRFEESMRQNLLRSERARQSLNQQIAEEHQRLVGLVDNLPEGVFLLNASRQVEMGNELGLHLLRQLAQAGQGDVVAAIGAKPIDDILSPPTPGLPIEIVDNGRNATYEINSRFLSHSNEWIVIIRDITVEKAFQEAVKASENLAALGQLAAGIAHDFNNILTTIITPAELLTMDPQTTPAQKKRATMILEQGNRAANLVRQILDFSRKSIIDRRPLDPNKLLADTCTLLQSALPENIQLITDITPQIMPIHADPNQLQRALTNLAINARDAMPNGGTLTFTLQNQHMTTESLPLPDMTPGWWVQLDVRDTGAGISEADLPHIFEPFFTTKGPGKGSGLGLSQVYGIVKQHEGFIRVQSQADAETTFTIFLPAHDTAETAVSPGPENIPLPRNGRGETILLVEDDAVVLDAISAILDYLGYVVIQAENGSQALAIFQARQGEINLVMTDIAMPVLSGIDLVQMIHATAPALPVLLITGYPLVESDPALRENLSWLHKPVQAQQLAERLDLLLGHD